MKLFHRSEFALTIIVAVYLLVGGMHLALTPVYEKPDEEWHSAYTYFLLARGQLPPLVLDPAQNPASQIAGHPPLFYAAGALLLKATGSPPVLPEMRSNPFWAYPAPGTVPDNKNRFLHAPDDIGRLDLRGIYLLRCLSLILGVGTLLAAYGIGMMLTGQAMLGLISAALIAILPQYTFIASSVSNDALVASLTGLALLALIHALRRGDDWRLWGVFGLLASLAALTKTSALMLPLFGAGTAMVTGLMRRSRRMIVMGVTASLGLWLVIAGWWYLRNTLLFDDPLGIGVHIASFGRTGGLTGWNLLEQWKWTSTSFWAAFGWGNVQLPGWMYVVVRVIEVVAIAGLATYLATRWRTRSDEAAWLALAGYVLLSAAAYLWWTITVTATLGRLLFPVLAPLAVFICVGLRQWSPRLLAASWAFVACMALLAPAAINAAYVPPSVMFKTAGQGDAGDAVATISDLARLQTVEVTPQRLAPGQAVTVNTCWEPLRRTEKDYAFFVQILSEENRKVGERTTWPGLGRYPTSQWQPGRPFCDEVVVPTRPEADAPAVYPVIVGLLDMQTGENLPLSDANGQPISQLVAGHVKLTGTGATLPPSTAPLDVNFADKLALIGYQIGPASATGETPLTLYWQALAPMETDYTVFVHLLDASGATVAQFDSQPQGGRYPTHWWDAGEIVADDHLLTLAAPANSAGYSLQVGLYALETGQRLRLAQGDGDSVELPLVQSD